MAGESFVDRPSVHFLVVRGDSMECQDNQEGDHAPPDRSNLEGSWDLAWKRHEYAIVYELRKQNCYLI